MTDLTEQRINITQQETSRRNAVSEALLSRVGSSINFINKRQYDTHAFHFNRLYSKGVGVVGRDGIFPILFDMEILGLTMWNRRAGTSGITELDVIWYSGSNSQEGSIFSTTPKFNTTVGNDAYMIQDFLNDTVPAQPSSGSTLAVLSKSEFDAGDALLCKIESAMSGAEDCSLLIHFRPR